MTPATLGLVLLAALLHAGWNLLVKSSGDRLVAVWGVVSVATACSVVVLAVAGLPPQATWPYVVASAVIHVGYNIALALAYDRADLSVSYPIARGSAPMLATLGGVLFLGDDPGASGVLGVLLVSGGIIALARARGTANGLGWAIVTGLFISSYTLVDAAGVRAGGESIRFLALTFVLQWFGLTAWVVSQRGWQRVRDEVVAGGPNLLLAGIGSPLAYLLVLIAARTAPIGLVSGLRETSVLIAVLLGRALLDEPVERRHLLAAGVIVTGAIAIAMA